MLSLNNCNIRSQMVLDIPLCRTIKDKKVCHFLDQRSRINYAQTQKQLQFVVFSQVWTFFPKFSEIILRLINPL